MTTQTLLQILEIIGTVAFAISGALVAIKAKFDIFGVIVVACVTAVGGGITRDLLIGQIPPKIFSNGYIVLIACLSAVAVFAVAYIRKAKFILLNDRIEKINNYFDALGLGAFTVTGVEIAFYNGLFENAFLAITMGVLTGVGGGLLRDIFTENTPYIFKKHVYALASILGATVYYVMRIYMVNAVFPTLVAIIIIVGLRILATKYRWSLPKVHLDQEPNSHETQKKQEK